VLGNGWSLKYYDLDRMQQDGPIIGCNRAFEQYTMDYIVWQDSSVADACSRFKGIMFVPFRKRTKAKVPLDRTYFFKPHQNEQMGDGIFWGSSGVMALQIAARMGFDPIIMVGCDCCLIKEGSSRHSNVVRERHLRHPRVTKGIHKVGNKETLPVFKSFARQFHKVYKKLKDRYNIFVLGDHSILDIPHIEIKEYWTDKHPGNRKKHARDKKQ